LQFMKFVFVCFLLAALAQGQSTPDMPAQEASRPAKLERANLLRELDTSLEQVVAKVSPAVVQILVSGFGPGETHGHVDTARIVRQHAIGSGVIVDPNGYVITNAHVVEGAQRVRVVISLPMSSSRLEPQPVHSQQIFNAKILGRHKKSDLALLKIEATHLPAITLRDDVSVRQGELVFAIGSPEGLRDSVTMGVVSSVARQTETNDAMFYIQTDAPLNPGNSGGPLVDIDGNLVGINTFMLSEGGGSEGLGFAIPPAIVKFDYENLRRYGHVQRVAFGAKTQSITPTLATGLGLSRSWGVIVSNVVSGGFAQMAGLEVGDIVTAVDGRPIDSLPPFMEALYLHPVDQAMTVEVLRGQKQLSVTVPVTVHHEKVDDLTDVPDLQRTLISELSMFVSDVDDKVKPLLHSDNDDSGVVVIAQAGGQNVVDTGVQAGDIIRAINRTPLQSVSQLQATVRQLKSGDAVVLQVDRGGSLQYLVFELD
jgi:serine protease Do